MGRLFIKLLATKSPFQDSYQSFHFLTLTIMSQLFKLILLVHSLLFFYACTTPLNIPTIEKIDLTGDWQFKQVGKTGWTKAVIPSVVQLDLLNAGLIEDPFYGTNETEIGWIEWEDWEYQKDFEVSETLLQQDVIELVFEGLDTYAEVWINGQTVLKSDNMFRTWRVNCQKHLKVGKNQLKVVFKSPLKEKEAAFRNLGYTLPAGNDAGSPKVSPFVRKAPYHFGWDWGPRVVTMGIWRPVYLEAYSFVKLQDVYYEQTSINTQRAALTAHIQLDYPNLEEENLTIVIKNDTQILATESIRPNQRTFQHQIDFSIPQPQLWWCNGLGDAHLYEFTIDISKDKQLLCSQTKKIGLRKIELVQSPDSIGTSYYFKLNGRPVFMKGANYIPQDNLLPRVTQEAYQQTIQNAVDANMNMLRVWGGGIYESDYFYEQCDAAGLLVWQDFMFACGMYPSDSNFVYNVQKEVEQNVQRLRNHACIALWCGNNEIEVAWNNWGWQKQFGYSPLDSTTIIQGYQTIFEQIIPNTLQKMQVQQPYVPTSPLSNWGTPDNFKHHSMHYWGVWHGREPFENYTTNVGRFMSEYGFQSFPNMQMVQQFSDSSQWHLESVVMKHHQKSYIGNGMIKKHLETYYPTPSSFSEFVYLSQLTQAYGMQLAIQSHRQSKGHCMGTLYWQLNDCWPGPSWSSIDYLGNWKALHYQVRQLYQDILIRVQPTDNHQVQIDLVSDKMQDTRGHLLIEVVRFDGTILNTIKEENLSLRSNQQGLHFTYPYSTLVGAARPNNSFIRVRFSTASENYEQLYYFLPPKRLALSKPDLQTKLTPIKGGFELSITSNTLIKNLFVQGNKHGNWSNNFFDLLPNQPQSIVLKTTEKITLENLYFLSINTLI
ncbi:glycosyl hydrolase 2 galactose-binding domain-containing protein [Aureispira sp. CCB-E]|uniref:beta-mannosidase n=1 Tax=Aureispira sp. CCB-E TaxID=3051121 RepID=UPI00286870DC|nr:glycoside hydrolase family 2 protein [Aureispira sp. CCB-E]WMX13542.1 glycoside hydrolase family 2 protein [Aureispira sp. CCB-E]